MIGTKNMLAALIPENKTLENTVPWTNDFFDPQNNAVIRSSRLKPNVLLIKLMEKYTTKKSAMAPNPTIESSNQLILLNIPLENEWLKLLYTIMRITVLSNIVKDFLCLSANFPQKRCSIKPRITGAKILMINSKNTAPKSKLSPRASKNIPIQSGVTIIPINPEILALKIAPGILPLAMETMTTDDDTVDGSAARKNTANHKVKYPSWCINGKPIKTSIGNKRNMEICTRACNFQFDKPSIIFLGLSFSPYKKKIPAMPYVLILSSGMTFSIPGTQ